MTHGDAQAFSPLPGFRYVFAEDVPSEAPTVTTKRRRLATNVVCLFEHDKEPVVNPRRRAGRYPNGIISLRMRDRIRPGAYCYIRSGVNYGRVVRVICKGWGRFEWVILAIGSALVAHNKDHLGQHCLSSVVDIQAHRLRRCAQPVLQVQPIVQNDHCDIR